MSIKDKFPFGLPHQNAAPASQPALPAGPSKSWPSAWSKSGDKLAPAPVYLLADHLDAVLAAGEDLIKARIVWDMSGREDVSDVLRNRTSPVRR